MTRMILSFFISGLVLALGMLTAFVQSANFRCAAQLDEMQLESQWYLRRVSLLREQIERNEFDGVDGPVIADGLQRGEQ